MQKYFSDKWADVYVYHIKKTDCNIRIKFINNIW